METTYDKSVKKYLSLPYSVSRVINKTCLLIKFELDAIWHLTIISQKSKKYLISCNLTNKQFTKLTQDDSNIRY